MAKNKERIFDSGINYLKQLVNKSTFRNAVIFSGGIILFTAGVLVYGIILNLREIPLSEAMAQKGIKKIKDPIIIINRKTYTLSLYDDTMLVKTYRASFGRNLSSPKMESDDQATPVGDYKICEIDTTSKYHKFFRLNYPNLNDDEEALRKGLVSQELFDKLKFEFYYKGCIDSTSKLGGNIGIEGIGEYNYIFKNLPFVYNWTDGSIAVSNEAIDELYSVVKKGTEVVIK
jgi:murein L,D-transpeptidase YafK